MIQTLYIGYFVAMCPIFVLNVYSQSDNCGYVSRENRANGDWPWMVAITMKMNMTPDWHDSVVCNGFLIDRRHVVTTARCPYPKSGFDNVTARIGKKNWQDGEEYKITCITRHPRFVYAQVYDDIAIWTLSRDVDTPNYTPICLPDDNLRTKRLDGLTVSKLVWEFVRSNIQFIEVRIISNTYCSKILSQELGPFYTWHFPGAVTGDMLCTLNPTDQRQPCLESSGAPLMYKDNRNKWIAVGMEVFDYSCTAELPIGYMKISDYVQWIVESTENEKDECS